MTGNEVHTYWQLTKFKLFGAELTDDFILSQRLAKALGIDYPVRGTWETILLTPELKAMLEKLNGPYGHIIYKMLVAQREEA